MKNTHIIIPIKDIETSLKVLKQSLNFALTDTKLHPIDEELATAIETEIEHRQSLLYIGKQISLNESDIRETALEKSLDFSNNNYNTKTEGLQWVCCRIGYSEGYSQALKNLL